MSASVMELQRAWVAANAGRFRQGPDTQAEHNHAGDDTEQWTAEGRMLTVVGAHPGAGATVLATAIATSIGGDARVIECAGGHQSGLVAASTAELGTVGEGHWVRGSREEIVFDRLAHDHCSTPCPIPEDRAEAATVLDPGYRVMERRAGWQWKALCANPVVVVTSATVPALRRTEVTLKALAAVEVETVIVAVVGGRTRGKRRLTDYGPLMTQAERRGQTLAIPIDRDLAYAGIDRKPISTQLLAAAEAVATQTGLATEGKKA